MIQRRITRQVRVGGVPVGGAAAISVQSMTNTPTRDVRATVAQIRRLEAAGCEIVRVAVPDAAAAQAISGIKARVRIPVIADIHFDHRLAVAAARAGADGLRINPGNIGGSRKVKAVVDCARDCGIPIRIGVNSGSLEKDLLKKYNGATPEGMVAGQVLDIRAGDGRAEAGLLAEIHRLKTGAMIHPIIIEGATFSTLSRMPVAHPKRWFPKITLTYCAPSRLRLRPVIGKRRAAGRASLTVSRLLRPHRWKACVTFLPSVGASTAAPLATSA